MSLDLEFILSQTDGRPMYLQIMEQIKMRITLGDWPQGFKLPSIREMAVATRVSVITVKRAYQELESEGVIVTQHGKGSFIAQNDNLSIKLKEEEMNKYLKEAIEIARSISMSSSSLQQRLHELQKLYKPYGDHSNKAEKNND
ncbi:MAG: GntR family transcriptional regulator [Marinicellaceae bacterium]